MNINGHDVDSYEEVRAVIVFFEKIIPTDSEQPNLPTLLLGLKARGYGENFIMPPGGHYEEIDNNNPVNVARREGQEETGLIGSSNMVVAKLIVTILKKKLRLLIDVVVFTNWTGELKEQGLDDEFCWLKFIPFSEITWESHLIKEKEWMTEVFVHCKPSLVEILCGENRNEVLGFKISLLHPKK